MWRYVVVGAVFIGIIVLGISLVDVGGGEISASAVIAVPPSDLTGYARAVDPWDWQFPRDHGSHPAFQTEWWYYTGNVQTEADRHFGFQFTIFRRALSPQTVSTESEWRSGQVYMAHFTVSDIEAGRFYHQERYSRGGADLAGAEPVYAISPEQPFRVWLEDWQVQALDEGAETLRIQAEADGFAVDLMLELAKPLAFQGIDGLSAKSEEPGNASYYYSMTRLQTSGTITTGGQSHTVSGTTWMDHEFSTSALGADAVGWDWFGLIFDDGREMTAGRIRLADGGRSPVYGGLLSYADGQTVRLMASDIQIEPLDTWTSPYTGAVYPAGWVITVDADALREDEDLRIEVMPLLADQELHSGDIAYWEGAVAISGDTGGYGYAELTGYVDVMTGRF